MAKLILRFFRSCMEFFLKRWKRLVGDLPYLSIGQLNTARMLTCLGHHETIHALDTHASILSWNYKVQVTNPFTSFIQAFEKSGLDESYLDTKDSEGAHANETFIECSALVSKMRKRVRPEAHS